MTAFIQTKKNKPWMEWESNLIKLHYLINGIKYCQNKLPERTMAAIRAQAQKMGIKNRHKYKEEEIQYLKDNYGKIKTKEIAKTLKRPVSSVFTTAGKFKLTRNDFEEWSNEELKLLNKHYSIEYKEKMLKLLPKRSWKSILTKGERLKLKVRNKGMNQILGEVKILLEDTPLSGYWLGFLLADGHFAKNNRLDLSLSVRDRSHLKKFAKFVKFKGKLQNRAVWNPKKTKKLHQVKFSIMDSYYIPLIKQKYDIDNRKTYNPPNLEIFKNMKRDFIIALIIGFIDGDGCIHKKNTTKCANILISVYKNWINILNLFLKIVKNEMGLNLPDGRIYGNYAKIGFYNYIHVKFLKKEAMKLHLPILRRKWNKIDLNFISRHEKHQLTKKI